MNEQEVLAPTRPDTASAPGRGRKRGEITCLVVVSAALIALVAGLGALALRKDGSGPEPGPAKCEPPRADDAPGYPALCAALNRPDLPDLAGVPGARVSLAGSHLVLRLDGDGEPPQATAQVQIGSVQVSLTDHPDLAAEDFRLFSDLPREQPPLLGRATLMYRVRTLGGGGATAEPGPAGYSRHLVVAKKPDGTGGSFDLSFWDRDAKAVDDTALRRIAEAVLPTLPGWSVG
ncbi:DUF6215 domain-containing protein [Kitasatospora sp. NPDC056327]|uniref:DUF6215 domain-containing protein n=1 Tax=Kitasatospora sp. NPDC056327 TaxID=3345785 RepID=UPI0035DCAAC5